MYTILLTHTQRLINEMDHNGNNQTSSRVSFTPNLASTSSPLRRSRADTMPSQSSAFPYASDIFSNLTLNTTSNLNMISSRHRSGSVTLPNDDANNHNTPTTSNNFAQTPFSTGYSPYDPSSPIDENASNTIASTLASLGLDDEDDEDDEEHNTPHTSFGEHNHHALGRARSYTIAGQLGQANDMPARLANGNFNPFSPHTRSSVLHRPRAISLGMVDSSISNAFSPFDMSTGQPKQTRFNNTPLRSSRSNSNLVDLNADAMYINDDDVSYVSSSCFTKKSIIYLLF